MSAILPKYLRGVRADAALAASIFHFGISDARTMKEELASVWPANAPTLLNIPIH